MMKDLLSKGLIVYKSIKTLCLLLMKIILLAKSTKGYHAVS